MFVTKLGADFLCFREDCHIEEHLPGGQWKRCPGKDSVWKNVWLDCQAD